jgi:EF-P beta-lysylation protein EpmB
MLFQKIEVWRTKMRNNITSVEKLAAFLELKEEDRKKLLQQRRFPLNLPLRLAEKIQKGTLEDPLLKQFVPLQEELENENTFINDPLGECQTRKEKKLLHKYQGRALLLSTGACAVHCRYCFRQHFDYGEKSAFEEELAYLKNDPSIHEVILSGGDPLSISNDRLEDLIYQLEIIPHLTKIRFHSRFPVAIPERIDMEFLSIVRKCSLMVWFVLHCNHPRELGDDLFDRMDLLRRAGAGLLNQAVLLRGVNDDVAVLQELFEKLSDRGIIPYYLHQLDRVTGTAHFEVPLEKGKRLMRELSDLLPGYALPKYVQEIAGQPGKSIIPY